MGEYNSNQYVEDLESQITLLKQQVKEMREGLDELRKMFRYSKTDYTREIILINNILNKYPSEG